MINLKKGCKKDGFKSKKGDLESKKLGYFMIIPATILILLISIYPLLNGILLSFQKYNLLKPLNRKFVGFENYIKILTTDTEFYGVLTYSFIYTVAVVISAYLFGLFLAVLLNRNIKGRGLYRALILLPWVISPSVASTNWLWLLNDQVGFINNVLRALNLIDKPILFIAVPDLARITVIFTGAWKAFPFMMIVVLAGLQSIPRDLYESAHIDGAGFWKSFFYITMPMIRGVSAIATTLMFIWTFNNFENIYLFTRGGPADATYVLPILTYYTAFFRSQLGYASAIAVIMLIVLLLLSGVYLRVLESQNSNVIEKGARK